MAVRPELERALPHNLEAERAVLGALLIAPQVYDSLPDGFGEAAFYRQAHRLVFAAVQRLRERSVEVDFVTVKEELTRVGQLDEVGGPAYVASLADGVPRSVNAPHYAAIVADHAARRGMIALANRVLLQAYEAEAPPVALMADAQRALVELGVAGLRGAGPATLGRVVEGVREELLRAVERGSPVVGVPTGYYELDVMTAGLQRGELALLAARPSCGKTALALEVALHVARTEGTVVFFSLEMTKAALGRRAVSSKAAVEGHRLRTGQLTPEEARRAAEAMDEMAPVALVIDDATPVPVEDLSRRVRRSAMGKEPVALIVVDYLQLLSTRSRHESRNQQVSFVSGALKSLAKEEDAPVLALSQLTRAVEGRREKRPHLSDLRESGSLEQDADVVLFIHRPDPQESTTEVIVAKQRNGPLGTVKLRFDESFTRFENLTYRVDNDERGW